MSELGECEQSTLEVGAELEKFTAGSNIESALVSMAFTLKSLQRVSRRSVGLVSKGSPMFKNTHADRITAVQEAEVSSVQQMLAMRYRMVWVILGGARLIASSS